jgi:hypothetical protein
MHSHISRRADSCCCSKPGVNSFWSNTTCTSPGTTSNRITVATASTSRPSVMMRWAYASPPSGSFFMVRTSCGTSTTLKMPPATRM